MKTFKVYQRAYETVVNTYLVDAETPEEACEKLDSGTNEGITFDDSEIVDAEVDDAQCDGEEISVTTITVETKSNA